MNKPRQPRHRITLALEGALWDRLKPVLKKEWKGSFTSWVEYAMECYSRETCKGCPYEPEEGQEKSPDGIGKMLDKEQPVKKTIRRKKEA